MTDNEKLNLLLSRLDILLKKQDNFSREINDLRHEINSFKLNQAKPFTHSQERPASNPLASETINNESISSAPIQQYTQRPIEEKPPYVPEQNQA